MFGRHTNIVLYVGKQMEHLKELKTFWTALYKVFKY